MSDRTESVRLDHMRRAGTLADLVVGMPDKDSRYALFLGAGASKSSGIPTALDLVRQWKRRLYLDKRCLPNWLPHHKEDFKRWETVEFPLWKAEWQSEYGRHPGEYSLLFDYVYPDTDGRQGFIEKICAGAEPGPGYIYLASLALSGYFQTFLTTNFDELLHDSLFRYAGLKPMVSAFDSQVSSIRLQSLRPKVIKLHGDFLYTNLKNVGAEVSRLDRNMEEKFERTGETYGLIVVGYGGQDQSIMAPIRSMLHRQDRLTHGLHWCVYRDQKAPMPKEVQIPEELFRMRESYPDKVHLYDVGSFDEVMEALYLRGRCAPPPDLAHPEDRALYARLRDGIENSDQTWRLSDNFSSLLGQFREATKRKPSRSVTLLDIADQLHRDGTNALANQDYEGALRKFQESIEKASEAIETRKEANAIQRVRAARRTSGSKTSAAEAILKGADSKHPNELDKSRSETFLRFAEEAVEDAQEGLKVDLENGALDELNGHRLNLWFNGLTGYANMLSCRGLLPDDGADQALTWLEGLSSDELFGDEYTEYLGNELGGLQLLELLADRSRSASPRAPASPESDIEESMDPAGSTDS